MENERENTGIDDQITQEGLILGNKMLQGAFEQGPDSLAVLNVAALNILATTAANHVINNEDALESEIERLKEDLETLAGELILDILKGDTDVLESNGGHEPH